MKAIYIMMEEAINESFVEYTDAFKKELDRRHAAYKSGKVKTVSAEESKKRIQKILKAAQKK